MSDTASTHVGKSGPRRKSPRRMTVRSTVAALLPGVGRPAHYRFQLCRWPDCSERARTEVTSHPKMSDGHRYTALCPVHRGELDLLNLGELSRMDWQPLRRAKR